MEEREERGEGKPLLILHPLPSFILCYVHTTTTRAMQSVPLATLRFLSSSLPYQSIPPLLLLHSAVASDPSEEPPMQCSLLSATTELRSLFVRMLVLASNFQ